MRRILIVFDSCRYDVYCVANRGRLDEIMGDPMKAYSTAATTVPSFISISSNNEMPKLYGQYNNPYFTPKLNYMSELERQGIPTYLLSANPFMHPLNNQVRSVLNSFTKYKIFDNKGEGASDILKHIETLNLSKDFYLILWFMETHQPYQYGNAKTKKYVQNAKKMLAYNKGKHTLTGKYLLYLKDCQIKATEWLCRKIYPFVEQHKNDEVILTSDHGESFGEEHKFGHGVSIHPTQFLVPFLYNKVK